MNNRLYQFLVSFFTVALWYCNFEISGNIATFCKMEQDKTDSFDWTLHVLIPFLTFHIKKVHR